MLDPVLLAVLEPGDDRRELVPTGPLAGSGVADVAAPAVGGSHEGPHRQALVEALRQPAEDFTQSLLGRIPVALRRGTAQAAREVLIPVGEPGAVADDDVGGPDLDRAEPQWLAEAETVVAHGGTTRLPPLSAARNESPRREQPDEHGELLGRESLEGDGRVEDGAGGEVGADGGVPGVLGPAEAGRVGQAVIPGGQKGPVRGVDLADEHLVGLKGLGAGEGLIEGRARLGAQVGRPRRGLRAREGRQDPALGVPLRKPEPVLLPRQGRRRNDGSDGDAPADGGGLVGVLLLLVGDEPPHAVRGRGLPAGANRGDPGGLGEFCGRNRSGSGASSDLGGGEASDLAIVNGGEEGQAGVAAGEFDKAGPDRIAVGAEAGGLIAVDNRVHEPRVGRVRGAGVRVQVDPRQSRRLPAILAALESADVLDVTVDDLHETAKNPLGHGQIGGTRIHVEEDELVVFGVDERIRARRREPDDDSVRPVEGLDRAAARPAEALAADVLDDESFGVVELLRLGAETDLLQMRGDSPQLLEAGLRRLIRTLSAFVPLLRVVSAGVEPVTFGTEDRRGGGQAIG